MNANVIRRLALIKYLHNLGMEQAKKSEPLNSLSILTFHDLVELFLQLICDKYDIKYSEPFLGYWDKINGKIKSKTLSYKPLMEKLNRSRVDFKHHGIIPSSADIESFGVLTKDFLEENVKQYFSLEYSNISLIDLIQNSRVKDLLHKADSHFKNEEFIDCMQELARAFEFLIFDYENEQRDSLNQSPFDFGYDYFPKPRFKQQDYNEKRFYEFVFKSIEKINKYLRITSFGIDYKKYIRFKLITPRALLTANDDFVLGEPQQKNLSNEDYLYCRDFIIESALILQNFKIQVTDNEFYDQMGI
jgi:hypothetical protein